MWEAIADNRRRSQLLIGLMGVILVVLGAAIGLLIETQLGPGMRVVGLYSSRDFNRPLVEDANAALPLRGAAIGAAAAAGLWLILWLVAISRGDGILLACVRARRINKEDAPKLWNVVEEMTIASGMGTMPRVYVIDEDAPNAFAVGRRAETAAVAVTSGLLRRLSRDELQGVIAHEIGHIRNLDVRFMTLAGVMVGAIVMVSDIFLHSLWFGGAGRRRSSSRGGGQAQIVIFLVVILLAVLAPVFAQLLYFACSRRREFLADASAARFTRYPEGLASALEKISGGASKMTGANRAVAPMFIINPLQSRAAFSLHATHPPTKERIQILRSMAGAGFAAYEEAFRKVSGRGNCVGGVTLKSADEAAIRAPTPEPEPKKEAVARAREAVDLIDRLAGFLLIPCMCGLRIKVPPDCKRDGLECPRCGRMHLIPVATAAAGKPGAGRPPTRYQRKGTGWETFRCSCGRTMQISPSFGSRSLHCRNCNRRVEIIPADKRE